jgi:hypothetical protein
MREFENERIWELPVPISRMSNADSNTFCNLQSLTPKPYFQNTLYYDLQTKLLTFNSLMTFNKINFCT